ncbi:MAG: aspartate aminotransferase [delta proteobacterium ML8_F1]|nr:MAG: aspartate aminotransferase [delta proteobacterium ML8_F1]
MLCERISKITPSYTVGITTKVKALKRQGIDVINLGVGEPDFPTPDKVKEAAIKAIHENKTKYDNPAGVLELREAIVKKLKKDNQLDYDADQIVVSSGAKHSITNALMAILNPLDEVIIPIPYWVSYPEMVKLVGGIPVTVETKKENHFKITPEEFSAAITPRTKMIFITNPSNPTGAMYTAEELKALVKVAVEKDIYILADEIYEKINFGHEFVAIASISKEAYDLTITVNGLSKSASMTGWRIGYTATNRELAKAMTSIQGHLVSHPSTISQWAAVTALENSDEETLAMLEVYWQRRDRLLELFKEIPEISVIEPQGAFYFFIDISGLKEKFPTEKSLSLKVCDDLLEKHRVAYVPGIAFGNDDFMRMSYATDMATIEAGVKALKDYVDSL